jgi:WhiB family redox-sensing transcriptional regulator
MTVHLTKLYNRWGRRPDWMSQAACRGEPTELFYPNEEHDAGPAQTICAGCPVRSDCLAHALANFRAASDAGVWGGTTEHERAAMRRRQAKERAKARAAAPVTSVT